MARVYNFSAGPAVLPEEVLREAAEEMMDYKGSGMSVMEMSHRSKMYLAIYEETEAILRELMGIPEDYSVLMLQGGATLQFAAVAMNLMTGSGTADYIDSGNFAHGALVEAQKYGDAKAVASSKDDNFAKIPATTRESFRPDADYVHICYNNTIYGSRFTTIPKTDATLVTDMSSCILSEVVDVKKFGLIYAGAQKNIAPAGLTIVIVKKELLGNASPICPIMLNYAIQDKNDSLYNTPPCYPIYMAKLVYEWILDMGGLEAMKAYNEKKAAILYDFLDSSKLFKGTVEKKDRSLMNVPFVTGDEALDAKFVKAATEAGFVNLKGHRSVGGMRASIYNAMPIEGVQLLVETMKEFEEKNIFLLRFCNYFRNSNSDRTFFT